MQISFAVPAVLAQFFLFHCVPMAKQIGILTSGGDCPGLNAAIRGVGKAGMSRFDMRFTGSHTQDLTSALEEVTGCKSRLTILGHVQRGGTPSPVDRVLATRLGTACAKYLADSGHGDMMAVRDAEIVPVPLEEVAGKKKLSPPITPSLKRPASSAPASAISRFAGGFPPLQRRRLHADLLQYPARRSQWNSFRSNLHDPVTANLVFEKLFRDFDRPARRGDRFHAGQCKDSTVCAALTPADRDRPVIAEIRFVVIVAPVGKPGVERP